MKVAFDCLLVLVLLLILFISISSSSSGDDGFAAFADDEKEEPDEEVQAAIIKEEEEESCCLVGDDTTTTCTTTTTTTTGGGSSSSSSSLLNYQIVTIGEATTTATTPCSSSKVLILHDFLDPKVVKETFREITHPNNQELRWTPAIPSHREHYHHSQRQQAAANNIGAIPLFHANTPEGGFPGFRTNLTPDYQDALYQKLQSLLRDEQDLLAQVFPYLFYHDNQHQHQLLHLLWDSRESFFGNVCYHPESLAGAAIPHVDHSFVEGRPIQLALVHYLSPTWPNAGNGGSGGGGTAFYSETRSGGATRFRPDIDCPHLQSCRCRRPDDTFCTNEEWLVQELPPPKQYVSSGTKQYPLVHHEPYQSNTALLYDAKQLHSAFISADADVSNLSCLPASKGRITANIFLI